MIQTLPPISKPLMRTLVEEIDGRDGDIVTNLGYSAYDREVTVGLYGSYNIDDVIKYFVNQSSGKAVFSNEPDKYYRYKIINQIDFERLIRFKTATVTFHVQPYKYSTEYETIIGMATSSTWTDTITNAGTIYSQPDLTVAGSGTISVYINTNEVFQITMGSLSSITIKGEEMNAYSGSNFANRHVTGNYNNWQFKAGDNTLTLTGTMSSITLSNFSRWI